MSKSRNLSIEGLRGLSLLLVMFSHYFARFMKIYVYAGQKDIEFLYIDRWGALGVAFFLLISGYFMIPSTEVGRMKYLKKRMIRIYPAYAIAITTCFIVTHIWYLPDRTVSITDYLLNLSLVNGFIASKYVDYAHWYITTLLSCTLCFSLIYRLPYKRRHYAYWSWLLILVLLYCIDFPAKSLHLVKAGVFKLLGHEYAPVVIIGAAIADIRRGEKKTLAIGTCVGALVVKCVVESGIKADFVVVLIAIPLFILAERESIPLLKWRPLKELGTISYSVYLIHQNIGFLILYYLMVALNGYQIWTSFIVLPIGIGMGYLLHFIDHRIQAKIKR